MMGMWVKLSYTFVALKNALYKNLGITWTTDPNFPFLMDYIMI